MAVLGHNPVMHASLDELKTRLLEINDLRSSQAVLSWDRSTYMPPGGAAARGRQEATLARIAHEKFTDPAIGRLLEQLRGFEAGQPYESDDASLVRVTRREYERATRVPAALVAELNEHGAAAYQVWTEARPASDFARVRPLLEKTLELSRRWAECFPHEHIADPLIDAADDGMKATTVRQLFAELRVQLVPIVQAIAAQPTADDAFLKRPAAEPAQLAFGRSVIERFGYDFARGRQDKTPHPFMTKFALGDVRITTRVKDDDLTDALFSTMHEAGHAMYEQGIDARLEGTPLGSGTSAGVHESQSRTWENLVGRSHEFWEFFYPQLQAAFPGPLADVSLDRMYRAINKVERSLIRTDADEVTYNLHVMLRFDLELALLEGKLAVKDLPEAWHASYQADLGIRAPDDRDGVLQDVHWFGGTVGGMFQGYTLGTVMSAQFYEAALAAHPGIPGEIRAGRFATLHGWLKQNIYRHGAKFMAAELVERATGKPLTIEPYVRYLKRKYGELYRL
jgi:carboxypeptidase Taq